MSSCNWELVKQQLISPKINNNRLKLTLLSSKKAKMLLWEQLKSVSITNNSK